MVMSALQLSAARHGLLAAAVTATAFGLGCAQSNGRESTDVPTPHPEALVHEGTLPPEYRDWRVISVAHEEGTLNDIRAVLGNDVAIKAYREGKAAFPDGTIITRLAWKYVPSEENNKIFGRPQSFVAGPPVNGVQFMVKNSRNTRRARKPSRA
jgi:hypothetical protein